MLPRDYKSKTKLLKCLHFCQSKTSLRVNALLYALQLNDMFCTAHLSHEILIRNVVILCTKKTASVICKIDLGNECCKKVLRGLATIPF